jgi:hypothetical protein
VGEGTGVVGGDVAPGPPVPVVPVEAEVGVTVDPPTVLAVVETAVVVVVVNYMPLATITLSWTLVFASQSFQT